MNRAGSLERKVADESTYLYAWFRDHLKESTKYGD